MPWLTVALNALLALSIDPVSVTPDAAKSADALVIPAPNDGTLLANPIAHAWAKWMLSITKSASPRDWALAAELISHDKDVPSHPFAGVLLRKAALASPQDRLVQQLWTNAWFDGGSCDSKTQCHDEALAWSNIDPDNGAAWVSVIAFAAVATDLPAIEAAIAHLASAQRYDDSAGDLLVAWKDFFQRNPIPQEAVPQPATPYNTMVASPSGMAVFTMLEMRSPRYQSLIDACNRSKNPAMSVVRTNNCGKAGRAMLTQSSGFIGRLMGTAVLRVSGAAKASDIAAARAMRWQMEQGGARKAANEVPELRLYISDFETAGSEVEATRKAMQSAGIALQPRDDWQPTNGKGERIDALGDPLAPAKHP